MLAAKFRERQRAAIIRRELCPGRVPLVPKRHRHPVRPHHIERADGRQTPEPEDKCSLGENCPRARLVHGAGVIRALTGARLCLSRRVDLRQEIAGISQVDGRSKNMLCRTAVSMVRRWATVLLTITAWILLSNHCALALGSNGTESDSKSGGCPMHSAPAKEKPATNLLCCKDLRAIVPQTVRNIACGANQLVSLQDCAAAILLAPPRLTTRVLALDTGPPCSLSFAESILQRSILSHAPPAGFPRR
jgi:hypothetical protein